MIKGWKTAYDYNENAESLHCFLGCLQQSNYIRMIPYKLNIYYENRVNLPRIYFCKLDFRNPKWKSYGYIIYIYMYIYIHIYINIYIYNTIQCQAVKPQPIVYFVSKTCNLCSASINTVLYGASFYIKSHHNGIPVYFSVGTYRIVSL